MLELFWIPKFPTFWSKAKIKNNNSIFLIRRIRGYQKLASYLKSRLVWQEVTYGNIIEFPKILNSFIPIGVQIGGRQYPSFEIFRYSVPSGTQFLKFSWYSVPSGTQDLKILMGTAHADPWYRLYFSKKRKNRPDLMLWLLLNDALSRRD